MRLGVDFGTTNSTIARYANGKLTQIRLDPLNDNPYVLPSLVYVDRGYASLVGTEAATEYLRRETGRPVRWEQRNVGEIEVVADGVHYMQDVHALVDMAANGRLLQSIKTGLRDGSYEGTQIFGRFYTVDELIALVLRALKLSAEAQLGEECDGVVIGRPVRFAEDALVTARAEEILFKAALYAGFRDIRFQMEPLGVVYLYHRATSERSTVLVFDFGGGTLDLAVAEVGGSEEPRILATQGVLVGGDDLDSRIMQSLFNYFGSATTADRPLPSHILESLSAWQTMPDLSRPQNRRLISDLKRTNRQRAAFAALETLVSRNLGFQLFSEIERAKKRLSVESATRLDFAYGEIDIHEVITRARFETMIWRETRAVEDGVWRVLADAGLRPAQIDTVLRTGGTSAVPAFSRMLATIFGEDKIRGLEMLTSVVGGLAVVAHDGGGWTTPYAERYAAASPLVSAIEVGSGRHYEPYCIRTGAGCYTDRPCTLNRVPVALGGLPAIRTATSDSLATQDEFLRFSVRSACRVYVAHEARAASIPDWLRLFTREEAFVEVDDWGISTVFQLYSREFPAGSVVLGGNQAKGYRGGVILNYLVAVRSEV